jgi:iron(III) transport system substrate-binding protein
MNKTAVIIIGVCLAILFGVPMFFRGDYVERSENARQVIIISPHNEQIRHEFGEGFAKWHSRNFGEDAEVVWSVPGGTSEIRRMLQSQYTHALEIGNEPGGEADVVFGGGSYEHTVLKKTITEVRNGKEVSTTISAPVFFSDEVIADVYGENIIGDVTLYDPEGHWYGLALSGFGIVYNNEILEELQLDSPQKWEALCNPLLLGKLALVNPAQSGSVTTAFEAILKNLGWKRGWEVMRRAAANSRYFSASSLKPPADVSQGDAAMGICIDFYGRYQSQAVRNADGTSRIGYVDPPNATMIDPDPISLLTGAPNKEIALRFMQYCMTEEAQALWQFSAQDSNEDGLGPDTWELRRMPIRRDMYVLHMDRMIDQVNPFESARPAPYPDKNMRSFIAPIFSGMAMNHHEDLVAAWTAIISHPAYPETVDIVTAEDVDNMQLKAMLTAFDAMPTFATKSGDELSMESKDNRKALKYGWMRKSDWNENGNLWHVESNGTETMRRMAAEFFIHQYELVVEESVSSEHSQ